VAEKVELEIKKISKETLDSFIRREHYLHRANSTKPTICYGIWSGGEIVALIEWSAIFKPVLLRFPFLHHLEIIDNSRFLIRKEPTLFWAPPPIYNLGSRALSLGIKEIRKDWEESTGVKPKLLITYVDKSRGYDGTVYRAANWVEIEESAGKNYSKAKKIDYKPTKKKTFVYPCVKGSEWKPVTFFQKSYLRENWKRLNPVAQYNYAKV
jgi:hypothetical protein